MKCLKQDLKRLFSGGWFWGTVPLTLAGLFAGIGPDVIRMFEERQSDFRWAVEQALASEASMITLPVFAALPYTAAAWEELKCKAARMAVFRCARRSWRWGKVLTGMVGAVGGQSLGLLLFCCILGSAPAPDMILSRMLLAAGYAWLGGSCAIWCRDSVIGCILPVAFCFACSLFGGRFFKELLWLQPENWLNGQCPQAGVLLAGAGLAAYDLTLRRGLNRYV